VPRAGRLDVRRHGNSSRHLTEMTNQLTMSQRSCHRPVQFQHVLPALADVVCFCGVADVMRSSLPAASECASTRSKQTINVHKSAAMTNASAHL